MSEVENEDLQDIFKINSFNTVFPHIIGLRIHEHPLYILTGVWSGRDQLSIWIFHGPPIEKSIQLNEFY